MGGKWIDVLLSTAEGRFFGRMVQESKLKKINP